MLMVLLMARLIRGRVWTLVSIGIAASVGLLNQLIGLPTKGYFDEYPSLARDLLYSRKLGGSPLPLELLLALLLAGVVCLVAGRAKTPLVRLLNLVGFLAIIGAWTPNAALVIGLLVFFLFLGWVVKGMGVEPSNPTSMWNWDTYSAKDYRGFWPSITRPSPRLHRTHIKWSFGVCWFFAVVLFVVYSKGGGGWLVRFPNTYSDPVPTIFWAVGLTVAPAFLAALFELFREPEKRAGY
jgi:hypothetical protein